MSEDLCLSGARKYRESAWVMPSIVTSKVVGPLRMSTSYVVPPERSSLGCPSNWAMAVSLSVGVTAG